MATVEMFLEEKERGLYRVEIEVGFPMLRRKEFFANTGAEALRLAAEAFAEFGVDDRARVTMMRPALQADIDRAQEAQQAAGDVSEDAIEAEHSPGEWIDPATLATVITFEPKDPEFVDSSEIVRRKPGRPRKEA